jgi:predicted ATPase/class 3 adenylate cyclase
MFTDLESSTRLWEQHSGPMQGALARHDAILRTAIEGRGGHVVKTTGDGFHGAFATPADAIASAADAQRALAAEEWGATGPLRARIGIHTGTAELRDGDYYGPALNRAARIMACGHGGQVLLSHITVELLGEELPDALWLLDLGEHRLRDLTRAEHVWQLCGPGLERDFPVLASTIAPQGNLPTPLSSFVGRDADLAEVSAALASARIVTLVGVGGVGKTRLALQSALAAAPGCRDGVWWCDLSGVRDVETVPEALAGTFGLAARDGMTTTEVLLEFLRTKDLLLVLDNCEHLTRSVAVLVRLVEEACPRVRVLATSREGLKVAGEQLVMVVSLEVPDDDELGAIRESDAARLLVERGRAVRPDFALDADNAVAVAHLCRRLDGLPLAIELAAARLAVLTPDELAQRLDQRFRLLTGAERTAVERHQTLRAAIDWSYELLSGDEQQLFDRLGVFAGGFSLHAAEAVCSGDGIDEADVFELLAGLVAKTLVVAEADRRETRYRQLETLRQYAQEHLAEDEVGANIRFRHAVYFTEFAEVVASELAGPDEQSAAARLSKDAGNVQGALIWALDHRDVDLALRLTSLCDHRHVAVTEVGQALRAAAESALDLPGADGHPHFGPVMVQAGIQAANQRDVDRARLWCDRARLHFRIRGVEPCISYWNLSSGLAILDGRFEDAHDANEHMVAACRASGDDPRLVEALSTLVGIRPDLDHAEARARAEEIVDLLPRVVSPRTKVEALSSAAFAIASEDPDRGFDLAEQALALAEESGLRGFGTARAIAAGMASRRGYTRRALELFAAALADLGWDGAPPPLTDGILGTVCGLVANEEPEAGAILQGAADRMLGSNMPSEYSAEMYRRATVLLDDRLGPDRRAALNARGRAMDETESTDFALATIERVLAANA